MSKSRLIKNSALGTLFFAVLIVIGIIMPDIATAHESRPLYVEIAELSPEVFSLRLRVPASIPKHNRPKILFPANCKLTLLGSSARAVCAKGLAGQKIQIKYPRFNPSVATLIRLTRVKGEVHNALLSAKETTWIVPEAETASGVAKQYMQLGIKHILGGYDHLLFLACLILIAGRWRRILVTVTGFTVAHSITLALAALGFVRVPVPPVEAVIALSIVFLASEIARARRDTLTWRHPVAVSSSFGLLHGLGFAAVLSETGLPQTEIPAALLFFNIGVEIGQIIFVTCLIGLSMVVIKLLKSKNLASFDALLTMPKFSKPASYLVGILAAFWMIDRMAGFWS